MQSMRIGFPYVIRIVKCITWDAIKIHSLPSETCRYTPGSAPPITLIVRAMQVRMQHITYGSLCCEYNPVYHVIDQ